MESKSFDASGFKQIIYDKVIIKGSFYSMPDGEIINKYLNDNGLNYLYHISKVGIDNYPKWVELFKSDYLNFKHVDTSGMDMEYLQCTFTNLPNNDDKKCDDFNKDNRVIIIEDEMMTMEIIHFYLNQMEMDTLYRYEFFENISSTKRELIIDVLYWWIT